MSKKRLAIIPARGGSKRIPGKNKRSFLGKPIIAYSIEIAIRSGLFDEVMVSTDDEEIAAIAVEYGARVPFFRSVEKAGDYATLTDVLIEVVQEYESRGEVFDTLCCLLATAPLLAIDDLKAGYAALAEGGFDSACAVVPFSYPILRALDLADDGILSMRWPEYAFTRSQDLKTAYHDTGTFYWIKRDTLLSEKKLFTAKGTAIVLDERSIQDIDTETDWLLAELKYKLKFPSP
ncbi:pseudaminic acid cytidylyltransferase [Massilibacteroides sp.]|uniref:pseudaminic acid cytidylyltransferase n=1 Tax=Massilibacteroides sp. TaxID=2034766 RepID=UPI002626549A|nr:pseudaminic acid cytidylyltransferase [Massilibacteroides sp.]MDD4515328.1 pseudaminic acid cytidylyltransferase [Massilibacteroides sp.]